MSRIDYGQLRQLCASPWPGAKAAPAWPIDAFCWCPIWPEIHPTDDAAEDKYGEGSGDVKPGKWSTGRSLLHACSFPLCVLAGNEPASVFLSPDASSQPNSQFLLLFLSTHRTRHVHESDVTSAECSMSQSKLELLVESFLGQRMSLDASPSAPYAYSNTMPADIVRQASGTPPLILRDHWSFSRGTSRGSSAL
jgi:hypothetical protein